MSDSARLNRKQEPHLFPSYWRTCIEFKSGARKEIQEKGFTILATISDQYSDLLGGYAQRTFKLPDPMYSLP
ncbi:MAG: hypothetical protein COS95_02525 [Ignavibacteriales bacterium CG07_land_8_20_14_0_80_59_12]|nr:MAG: hypothetical protein COS95_02525 [Ignavibacteriales bacterium CG07_land_8_20_14_0_80_59_12]